MMVYIVKISKYINQQGLLNRMIEEQQENEQIHSLKKVLTSILQQHTAYDCIPINSSINSVNMSVSLYDAINILIYKDLQQLLIWNPSKNKWIWMLTLVDAIRFITHALKSLLRHSFIGLYSRKVDFSDFQKQKDEKKGQMISIIAQCTKDQLSEVIQRLQQKTIQEIINQITEKSPAKNYIRLKSVQKQAQLSLVINTMREQKIHRIIIQDTQSGMYISVLNFKDIFLFIMKIANQSVLTYNYGTIGIQSLLQNGESKNIQIQKSRPLWEAFQIMTDRDKSVWINVVDKERRFVGMLFRQDFRQIFQGWHVDYMWMNVGEFILWKKAHESNQIPEFRFFQPTESTKDIIWKMIMSRRNAIVWVDNDHIIQGTIGLMEVFKLYLS